MPITVELPQPLHSQSACRAIAQPIAVHTLVIRGDSDAFSLESMYSNLQKLAPGSGLLTIKDCSHWIQQDR